VDSFTLYCLAAEIRSTEPLRALGLIERRLASDPADLETRLYKGALLARASLDMTDPGQSERFLLAGIDIMRAIMQADDAASRRPLASLRMLYARGTTQALLPVPPLTPAEVHQGIDAILDHPGFERLHGLRRAMVFGMQAHLLLQQGYARSAQIIWREAMLIDSRISGFPDVPPQIIL